MKYKREIPTKILDSFLAKLGEPVPSVEQMNQATDNALNILRIEHGKRRTAIETNETSGLPAFRLRWLVTSGIAAGVSIALLLAVNVNRPAEAAAVVEAAEGSSLLRAGHRIEPNQTVSTDGNDWTRLTLADGSRVEAGNATAFSIGKVSDGIRLNLARGRAIVTASKQRSGHLYVETSDCTVSVTGTVFSVSVDPEGSHISVMEGEVHVQHGQVERTLTPGQEFSTNPAVKPVMLREQIGWSPRAESLIALFQQSAPQISQLQNEPDSIKGVVTHAGTSDGLAGVLITLCGSRRLPTPNIPGGDANGLDRKKDKKLQAVKNSNCNNPLNANTDGQGRFSIHGVAPGTYTIRASHDAFVAAAVNPANPGLVSAAVDIDTRQSNGEVALSMARGAAVSGRIRDTDGNMLVNTTVEAAVMIPQKGVLTLRTVMSVETNDRGEYRMHSLPPGDYYVSVFPRLVDSIAAGFKLKVPNVPAAQTKAEFVQRRTFYGGVANVADAAPITVKEGEEVTSIDFTIRPAVLPR